MVRQPGRSVHPGTAYPDPVLHPLPVPAGPAVLDVLPAIRSALAGSAPLVPYAAGSPLPDLPSPAGPLPAGLALVVGTSGSTGTPKRALLTVDALCASATATHEVLGGAGSWLLAMPAHHIAGLQVLVRSVLAGADPAVMDLDRGFTAGAFLDAATRHTQSTTGAARRYTALVPTQVARLLEDRAATAALAAYDAVLVGGAGTPAPVRARAAAAGVRLVPTYGMSETAGGCVYAGRALPCSRVALEDDEGRVLLGGATLAAGYLGASGAAAAAFVTDDDGRRWFRTDDAGHLGPDGLLRIDGRLDDLVNTGGLKVAPRLVEDALLTCLTGIREAVVVGVADPEWGQVVSAALATDRTDLSLEAVRDALRAHLPDHALPRRLRLVGTIPARGPGKPDRRAVASWFVMGQ